MNCPRCNVEMVVGQAIKPNTEHGSLTIVPAALTNAQTLEIMQCLKCPRCGHSDDGK